MIFITVGTTTFNSLAEAADNLKITDEIIIQKADGDYLPKNHQFFEFSDKFDDYCEKAEVVVTHGGAGTLFKLLEMNKKIVGVANEERSDLHQSDILKKLSDEGHIVWCQNVDKLDQAITKAKKNKLKKYTPPKCTLAEDIKKFII